MAILLVQQQRSHGVCVEKKLSRYFHVMFLPNKGTYRDRQNVIARIMVETEVETVFWESEYYLFVCSEKFEIS